MSPTLSELLAKPIVEIQDILGALYEHSPWVGEEFIATRSETLSITTISELAAALKRIVDSSSHDKKLALLRAHPDLCEKVGKLEHLTKESQEEQGRSGLQSLTDSELEQFHLCNTKYRDANGFPFILAVRNATKYTVLAALTGRVKNPVEVEFATALQQVHIIAWMRLLSKIDTSDAKGFLTCHVLDTANGCPDAPQLGLLAEFVTNDDGRLECGPALKGGVKFSVGSYEWEFYVGDYFASKGTHVSGTPFLDVVPLRFGIDNPDDHYHVPLLVSPWSYSTYRGS